MNSAVELYEALSTAPDDRTRARLIAEAFERLEERYPHLPDLATQSHVRESELRLQKEIEQARAEQRQSELRLQQEIEQVRAEQRESELRLRQEIEQARAEQHESALRLQKEIEQVRVEIAHAKADLLKWIVPLMFAQVAAIAALVKLL